MMQEYLVASPNIAFGDLLRLSLEEDEALRVHLAHESDAMLEIVAMHPISLLILDTEMVPDALDPMIQEMLIHKPELRFIFLLPENAPSWQPDIPNPFFELHQPYFISTVLEMLDTLLGNEAALDSFHKEPKPSASEAIQDREVAGFILTSFLRESSAHSALILTNGELHLSQGYLNVSEVQEIVNLIKTDWNVEMHTDLARFVKLQSSGGKYLVYVREHQPDVLLALVEDIRSPISEARQQAIHLQQMLNEQVKSFELIPEDELRSTSQNDPNEEYDAEVLYTDHEEDFETSEIKEELESESDGHVEVEYENLSFSEDELSPQEKLQEEKLKEMLAVMPSPNPDLSAEVVEETPLEEAVADWQPFFEDDAAVQAEQVSVSTDVPAGETTTQTVPVEDGFPGAIPVAKPLTQEAYRPEPATSIMADLAYTFVLLPRIPVHFLDSETQRKLSVWIPDLCLAFGWKLSRLQIQPEYLLWSTQMTPGVSPASVIRVIRQRTSSLLFEFRGYYRSQNPSGDFWAPGYMVLSGAQLPDDAVISEFILQTRQQQGIPVPRKI